MLSYFLSWYLINNGVPLTPKTVSTFFLWGQTVAQRLLRSGCLLGSVSTLIHVDNMPNTWSFIRCNSFLFMFTLRLSLLTGHKLISELCTQCAHPLVPTFASPLWMSFTMELVIMIYRNSIHVEHKVTALRIFGRVIATARRRVLLLHKSRRPIVHGFLACLLLKLGNFGCQGIDETSKVLNFTCFLFLCLTHSILRPLTLAFGSLNWFVIYIDSNSTQIFLHINCLCQFSKSVGFIARLMKFAMLVSVANM